MQRVPTQHQLEHPEEYAWNFDLLLHFTKEQINTIYRALPEEAQGILESQKAIYDKKVISQESKIARQKIFSEHDQGEIKAWSLAIDTWFTNKSVNIDLNVPNIALRKAQSEWKGVNIERTRDIIIGAQSIGLNSDKIHQLLVASDKRANAKRDYHPTPYNLAHSLILDKTRGLNGIKTVVDVGSGIGMLTLPMAQNFPQLRLITSLENNKECRERSKELFPKVFTSSVGLETVDFDVFTFDNFPVNRDLVVSNPHWDESITDYVRWILFCTKMAKNNGRIIFITPKKYFYATMSVLRNLFGKNLEAKIELKGMDSGASRTDLPNPSDVFVFDVKRTQEQGLKTEQIITQAVQDHRVFTPVQKEKFTEFEKVNFVSDHAQQQPEQEAKPQQAEKKKKRNKKPKVVVQNPPEVLAEPPPISLSSDDFQKRINKLIGPAGKRRNYKPYVPPAQPTDPSTADALVSKREVMYDQFDQYPISAALPYWARNQDLNQNVDLQIKDSDYNPGRPVSSRFNQGSTRSEEPSDDPSDHDSKKPPHEEKKQKPLERGKAVYQQQETSRGKVLYVEDLENESVLNESYVELEEKSAYSETSFYEEPDPITRQFKPLRTDSPQVPTQRKLNFNHFEETSNYQSLNGSSQQQEGSEDRNKIRELEQLVLNLNINQKVQNQKFNELTAQLIKQTSSSKMNENELKRLHCLQLQKYEARIKDLIQENDDRHRILQAREKICSELEFKIQDLESQNFLLSSDQNYGQKLKEEKEQNHLQLKGFRSRITELVEQIASNDQEIHSLQQMCDMLTVQNKELSHRNDQKEQQLKTQLSSEQVHRLFKKGQEAKIEQLNQKISSLQKSQETNEESEIIKQCESQMDSLRQSSASQIKDYQTKNGALAEKLRENEQKRFAEIQSLKNSHVTSLNETVVATRIELMDGHVKNLKQEHADTLNHYFKEWANEKELLVAQKAYDEEKFNKLNVDGNAYLTHFQQQDLSQRAILEQLQQQNLNVVNQNQILQGAQERYTRRIIELLLEQSQPSLQQKMTEVKSICEQNTKSTDLEVDEENQKLILSKLFKGSSSIEAASHIIKMRSFTGLDRESRRWLLKGYRKNLAVELQASKEIQADNDMEIPSEEGELRTKDGLRTENFLTMDKLMIEFKKYFIPRNFEGVKSLTQEELLLDSFGYFNNTDPTQWRPQLSNTDSRPLLEQPKHRKAFVGMFESIDHDHIREINSQIRWRLGLPTLIDEIGNQPGIRENDLYKYMQSVIVSDNQELTSRELTRLLFITWLSEQVKLGHSQGNNFHAGYGYNTSFGESEMSGFLSRGKENVILQMTGFLQIAQPDNSNMNQTMIDSLNVYLTVRFVQAILYNEETSGVLNELVNVNSPDSRANLSSDSINQFYEGFYQVAQNTKKGIVDGATFYSTFNIQTAYAPYPGICEQFGQSVHNVRVGDRKLNKVNSESVINERQGNGDQDDEDSSTAIDSN